MQSSLLVLAIGTAVATGPQVSRAELAVGDPAPKLGVGKWVQGGPVGDFESNRVYIVEFWATWCGPCRESIPHLNQLAESFKDQGLIVIGQDVWDRDEAVEPFVKQMGDKMTYRVALDDKSSDSDGFMSTQWWKRGVNHHGIPEAFVIKDRRIAWMGHPMGLTEVSLKHLLSDHYDMSKAAAEYKKQLQVEQQFQVLNDQLRRALSQKKWDAAAASLDEITLLLPEERRTNYSPALRLEILLGQKKYEEAFRLADSLDDTTPAQRELKNNIAWSMLTQKTVEPHALALARGLAARANQSCGGTNAETLDTLARAQFMSGQTNEAIATEQRADGLAPSAEKVKYDEVLSAYRQGKLPEMK
jgi:thiol-disulfide isomerase/thioredoxin